MLASLCTSLLLGSTGLPDMGRLLGFVAAHALFLGVITAAVIAASLRSLSARTALLALLAAAAAERAPWSPPRSPGR